MKLETCDPSLFAQINLSFEEASLLHLFTSRIIAKDDLFDAVIPEFFVEDDSDIMIDFMLNLDRQLSGLITQSFDGSSPEEL
jgi:hypothetical protein